MSKNRTGGDQRFNLKRRIVREMYVNGFRTKRFYLGENAPNTDEPYRNIANALGTVMELSDEGKKIKSATHDHMRIVCNPLYQLYKTRTMKPLQYIVLFSMYNYLHDRLASASDIARETELSMNVQDLTFSWLKEQVKKYAQKGLISCRKKGRNYYYTIEPQQLTHTRAYSGLFDRYPSLPGAVAFFSEVSPLGAIGSNIMDSIGASNKLFAYKHQYISTALDQLVLLDIFEAIRNRRALWVRTEQQSQTVLENIKVIPIQVRRSTLDGRQYLSAYDIEKQQYRSMRADYIHSVEPADDVAEEEISAVFANRAILDSIWGYSHAKRAAAYEVRITFRYDPEEEKFIEARILRERRLCEVVAQESGSIVLSARVTNPKDMVPWLLSFTGFVESVSVKKAKKKEKNELLDRFVDHVQTAHREYAGEKKLESTCEHPYKPTSQTSLKKWNKREDDSQIFSEVSCNLLNCLIRILGQAVEPVTKERLKEIIRQQTFVDYSPILDCLSFEYLLENGFVEKIETRSFSAKTRRTEVKEEYRSAFPNIIHRPLSVIELRWIRTILEDPRIALFMGAADVGRLKDELEAYPTIYDGDAYVCHDMYLDGDPYGDEGYQRCFGQVIQAVQRKKKMDILYDSKRGRAPQQYKIIPVRLEYSLLEDKFRVLAYTRILGKWKRQHYLLARIVDASPHESKEKIPDQCSWEGYTQMADTPLEVIVADSKTNSLERFMIAFSIYKKESVYDTRTGLCRVKIWYYPGDEKELLCKIRSYGKNVLVLNTQAGKGGKETPRARIVGRLERQIKLINEMKNTQPAAQ